MRAISVWQRARRLTAVAALVVTALGSIAVARTVSTSMPDERATSTTQQVQIGDARRIERTARAPEGAESTIPRAHRSVPEVSAMTRWRISGTLGRTLPRIVETMT
jgi:hypothetical protein